MAEAVQPQTFLSAEYLQGGVYYWPALIALFFFFVAIGISAFSLPHEEAGEQAQRRLVGFGSPSPSLAPAGREKQLEEIEGEPRPKAPRR
jgi:hypothetical protein